MFNEKYLYTVDRKSLQERYILHHDINGGVTEQFDPFVSSLYRVSASNSLLVVIVPVFIGVLELLSFRSVVVLLCSMVSGSASRVLLFSVIPDPLFYVVFNCFMTPFMVYHVLRMRYVNARKAFLYERTLELQLEVAERALRFEAPTDKERAVLEAVLDSAAAAAAAGGAFGGGGGGVSAERGSRRSHRVDGEQAQVVAPQSDILFEELELHERIAAGAFGEVIKATYLGSTVAVKRILRSRIDPKQVKLFLEEAALLRTLRHPNIVQFVGLSFNSVVNICIVFEFMERGSLSGILADTKLRLSWEDPKLKMMVDVISGLAYLHAQRPAVMHRDLKPDNVLVTSTFGCKITDFGASRETDDVTMTTTGTPRYMAPEVFSGAGYYDEKVDMYGFAMVLYETTARKPPFSEGSYTMNIIRRDTVAGKRPSVPPGTPAPLEHLMESCWAQLPEDRPTAVQAMSLLRAFEEDLKAAASKHDESMNVSRVGSRRPNYDPTFIFVSPGDHHDGP